MAAATTTTRATVRQKVAKKLYKHRHPVLSTTTAGSAVTTGLTDSFLLGAQRAEDFIGAWIYTYNAPGSGVPINTLNRVVYTDFSSATPTGGILRMLPAAPSGTYVSGTNYEIHYKFSPTVIEDMLNEILENLRTEVNLPVTRISDGDMESSGTSSFSVSGGGVLSKVTTPVFRTRQSLLIAFSAANEIMTSNFTTRNGPKPNDSVLVEVMMHLDSVSEDVTVQLWDATNSVLIDSGRANTLGWSVVKFIAQIPATCEQASVRILKNSTGATNVYVAYISCFPINDRTFEFPDTFEWGEDFSEEVLFFQQGNAIDTTNSNNCFRVKEHTSRTLCMARLWKTTAANSGFQIELLGVGNLEVVPWVKGYVDYATLSADSTTTLAPEDLLVGLIYADLLEDWAQEDLDDGRTESYQAKMAKAMDVRKKYGPRSRHSWKDKGRVYGALR